MNTTRTTKPWGTRRRARTSKCTEATRPRLANGTVHLTLVLPQPVQVKRQAGPSIGARAADSHLQIPGGRPCGPVRNSSAKLGARDNESFHLQAHTSR